MTRLAAGDVVTVVLPCERFTAIVRSIAGNGAVTVDAPTCAGETRSTWGPDVVEFVRRPR